MDNLNINPETAQGLQNLSAKDRQELNQFVVQESSVISYQNPHQSHTLTRLAVPRPEGADTTDDS